MLDKKLLSWIECKKICYNAILHEDIAIVNSICNKAINTMKIGCCIINSLPCNNS